jgi:hypothetical protein
MTQLWEDTTGFKDWLNQWKAHPQLSLN